MIIKCIAIDDEPLALDKIEGYVSQISYLEFVGRFNSALSALSFMKENTVDLIFLDIQMDGLTGIQLLESLTVKPKVIITSAYDKYAIKGFELDVSDYLLKPIAFTRFLKSVDKVYNQFVHNSPATKFPLPAQEPQSKDFIFIKSGNRYEKIHFSEILYIEGMKDYLRIHTPSKKVMTNTSFSCIEELLPENNFVRIHKSFIVAIDKIEVIDRAFVKIAEVSIPIGETFRKSFRNLLQERGLSK
ncbi:MAG TPA: LytTR family DNA-binding domain-containing protein [Tenuifilaceae bacterium]|nr:LytTR family DNA-binding domain-containing protein [Tenuifilaceae bacterium]HPE19121.1 LytTR family DNA-binding domain-containing protein [Tenuifilaceae bacterium]HPJ45678.1 LytTR family DNA-binding domain-containing protein [Tenuifilaceae bacterium]HPQ35103.1 LytTR family DNA-binding domain-containing protein [Tenuifilaceae bacterium]HRX68815.1 LytTR family DNA-binding domain-containing protein [Tenuifilaceae bacterium]